jgi:glycosyltransferase 2 family protein
LALFFLVAAIGALKWQCLIPRFRFGSLYRVVLIGMFYAVILPSQLAGDVFRAYRLGAGKSDAAAIAASVVVDKVNGLVGLLILGLIGALASTVPLVRTLVPVFGVLLACVLLALFAVNIPGFMALAELVRRRLEAAHSRFAGLVGRILTFLSAWRTFLRRPVAMFGSFAFGIVYQLLCIAIILLLAISFGIDVRIFDWLWIFTLISLAVLPPISVGGLGVREGTLVGALGVLGVSPADALAVSLSIFGSQLVGAFVGGMLELFHHLGAGRRRDGRG